MDAAFCLSYTTCPESTVATSSLPGAASQPLCQRLFCSPTANNAFPDDVKKPSTSDVTSTLLEWNCLL